MTILNTTPHDPPATAGLWRGSDSLLARAGRLINHLVAAAIVRHERQAELSALGRLSDRGLKDMGLYRCQIGLVWISQRKPARDCSDPIDSDS